MSWWTRFRCRIGWHRWSKWRSERYTVRTLAWGVQIGETRGVEGQVRNCLDCNYEDFTP